MIQNKKILIAYQDDIWVRLLSACFHSHGYRVETARVLSEMIRKVQWNHFEVILLDDEIEGLKACGLVSLLKKVNSRVQVFMISSEESLSFVRRLRGAGIFYQAMKPVDMGEIHSAVRCAFEKLESEKEGFFSLLIPKLSPA